MQLPRCWSCGELLSGFHGRRIACSNDATLLCCIVDDVAVEAFVHEWRGMQKSRSVRSSNGIELQRTSCACGDNTLPVAVWVVV